jgi:hypothetical protein
LTPPSGADMISPSMPNVLIVAQTGLESQLGQTCLWGPDVRRVATPCPEVALELVRAFVPSLLWLEVREPRAAAEMARQFRSHRGTRRSSIVLALPAEVVADDAELEAAGASLVVRGTQLNDEVDARLALLLAVPRRVRLEFPVWVAFPGQEHVLARAVDLSVAGMLLAMPDPPAVNATVELQFTVPGYARALELTATVVRRLASSPPGVGLHFTTLDPATSARLHEIVKSMPDEWAFGRYEPRAVLAEGSMGRVYRAFDPAANRMVALKTVKPAHASGLEGSAQQELFQREVRAAARLSHPNVVTIFDVGPDYFVMELLGGVTMRELLATHGRLPEAELSVLLSQVASALDYAHERGVVHRDVKPANIIIDPEGRSRVMDFGLAHLVGGGHEPGMVVGSPAYMAPEQISGGDANTRSDVFSLAVSAYEALTGERPFDGPNVAAILWAIVNADPVPPSCRCPGLTPAQDAALLRGLARDPAQRFARPGELVAALLGAADPAGIAGLRKLVSATRPPAPAAALVHDPGTETIDLDRHRSLGR